MAEVTTLEQLREEIFEIRQHGKMWGFEDDEIDECLAEALDSLNNPLPTPEKTTKRRGKFGKCLRYGFFTLVAFVAAIALLYNTANVLDEQYPDLVTRYLVGISYPLLRYSRLIFLPLHQVFDITGYYNAECIISNPWFTSEAPESCWYCQRKKKLTEISPDSSAVWKEETEVGVFRGALKKELGFSDLQTLFRENKGILQAELRSMLLVSNRSNIATLEELFGKSEQDILSDRGLHFQCKLWKPTKTKSRMSFNSLATNRILRQLFGRPSFVESRREISFQKSVIVQSPGTAMFELPEQSLTNGWYMQISGTRQLTVKPSEYCQKKCSSFDVTLQPGDAFVYTMPSWHIWLLPSEAKEVSIGYQSSFM